MGHASSAMGDLARIRGAVAFCRSSDHLGQRAGGREQLAICPPASDCGSDQPNRRFGHSDCSTGSADFHRSHEVSTQTSRCLCLVASRHTSVWLSKFTGPCLQLVKLLGALTRTCVTALVHLASRAACAAGGSRLKGTPLPSSCHLRTNTSVSGCRMLNSNLQKCAAEPQWSACN